MSEPITRTVLRPPIPGRPWADEYIEEVSVPWCETHNCPFYSVGAGPHGDLRECVLLDPHAPTAVWRGVE